MPTYLYQCPDGYQEYVQHPMTEDPIIECKVCLVPMTRKPQFNAHTFKGKGFYSTGG